ncbi:O-methyltransferase [Streptomyces subrutilus]|uniref:Protein-L-isoaspartate O-methyltransferase n=1 Tax=Streptomyces subrutilus TaxID=36818 RepID=A0A5P2UVM6_9ACTN|nr:methyltransferase, FxLD system [Streptomyces subrutilus]QEU82275.1 methyltransferase, FxLD system [Streptomyces subrutilus]GGZ98093.1 O-methyltransferase [Streptomyces subrutilus]
MDWQQLNITFADRATGRQAIQDTIGPALAAAEDAGHVHAWWYMNKQPWPLRILSPSPVPPAVTTPLHALVAAGKIDHWFPATYEPETFTFGGPTAMDAAHALFHQDSRHLLAYTPGPAARHMGRRESTVVLCSTMMRAAGLDWYEQGDVWAKVADLRTDPTTAAAAPAAPRYSRAMRRLMTVDTRALTEPGAVLDGHHGWVTAFEVLGKALARLAHRGELTRGLRAVLAHHVIFHANRAGLPLGDQHTISTIAREVVMGSSDNNALPTGAASNADSVSAVNTDTTSEAARLRNRLVDQIRVNGHATTPEVEAVLRTVPRHVFVPGASLHDAYADAPVNIKYDTDGKTAISCASQPGVVALMLDQLSAQPGDKVLELGAGTGYNAGLIAHLVGQSGHVTTIDVDEDLVDGARTHLAAAGITNVETITRDGALGHAEGAPYDRIIATVGAHGIPHAWLHQLAPGGRLVVPQRLKGSVSRSIAYEQHDGRWVSLGSQMNTFMPLRRGIADDDRRVIALSTDGTVRLQAPAGQHIDADALAGVLEQPRVEHWTGVTVRAMESPEWMELFVSCTLPSGLVRMLFPQTAKGTHLTEDPYPSSTAAVDKGAVTYLARRLSDEKTPEGGKLWEFGVIGHGPGSDALAAQVAEAVQTWDREYRGREATFEIQAPDAPVIEERPGRFAVDTPLNRIVIDWQ